MKLFNVIFIVVVCLCLLACTARPSARTSPMAKSGVLDLRGWDFRTDGPVRLIGEWEFYWNQLLTENELSNIHPHQEFRYIKVPSSWNAYTVDDQQIGAKGYATYHLTVLTDPLRGFEPALKLNRLGTAYELDINGKRVAQNGRVATSKDLGVLAYRPVSVSLKDRHSKWSFVVRVSNYHNHTGGFWNAILFGNERDIKDLELRQNRFEWFLFGSILIMGFYHFSLFALRRTDRSALWFGIFCLLIAVRVLTTGERYLFQMVPEHFHATCMKLDYLTFYLAWPAFALFMRHLFPEDFSRKLLRAICAIGLLAALIVICLPLRMFSETLTAYQMKSCNRS